MKTTINSIQRKQILHTDKAIRIKINTEDSHFLLWIPKSCVIEITGWSVIVKSWVIEKNIEFQKFLSNNKDSQIITNEN